MELGHSLWEKREREGERVCGELGARGTTADRPERDEAASCAGARDVPRGRSESERDGAKVVYETSDTNLDAQQMAVASEQAFDDRFLLRFAGFLGGEEEESEREDCYASRLDNAAHCAPPRL